MTMIPELYDTMRSKLADMLAAVQYISFTTDEWSTSQCTDSLLSVTAHWIDGQWQRRSAVVAASPVEGSRTVDVTLAIWVSVSSIDEATVSFEP
jgi:hypothetical protein